jgi:hypothetical protein
MTDEEETPPKLTLVPSDDEIVEGEETVELKQMAPEAFIRQAQDPGLRQLLDKDLDAIQEKTGSTWKQMLRGYALVLRSIAVSMPWDEEEGLDAKRLHTDAKMMLPSWRECIGVVLGLSFDKADAVSQQSPEEEEAPDDEQSEE